MPEGYIQRLNAKALNQNDLAWQALIEVQEPGDKERSLVAAADLNERRAHTFRKAAERLQIERGVSAPTTGPTWHQRMTAIGNIEIPPSEDLLLGTLHPTAHTILFGQGDTGKGTIAAWLALNLHDQLDLRVLILDFEHNPGEWQPRLQSLGYTDTDAIHYYDPAPAPIWDQADDIAAAAHATRAHYVIVDSLVFACMTDTSGGDPMHVANYKAALTRIGLPTLSLAHIPKATTEPKWPFGSIFWHNAARTTWRIDHLEIETAGTVPSRKITLTCCKRNDGPHPPKQIIEIIYAPGPTGLPVTVESHTYHETQARRFLEILMNSGAPMSSKEIADAYNATLDPEDDNAKQLDAKAIGKVMKRHSRDTARSAAMFRVDTDSKWSTA